MMEAMNFHDGNVHKLRERRSIDFRHDKHQILKMHSSLLRRLSMERELEGHQGCVNTISWNSRGSLLLSGSDDTTINVWSHPNHKLLHSIDTGHSANIFSAKFVPETSDELVASGAGDAEVRIFNLSHLKTREHGEDGIAPSAVFHCHTRRVKTLAVEVGNPNVVWSASEDGTLRQHDFREGASCPPTGSSHQECRNVLLDLRGGSKTSLVHPPKHLFGLKSCDISPTRSHLLLVGGSDAFARLYDRRMLSPLSSCQKRMPPPPCVNYFCPMHLSEQRRPILHLTHVTFSPDGEEVLLSYSGEHAYLMDINYAAGGATQYIFSDVSALTALGCQDYGNKFDSLSSQLDCINHPLEKNSAARLDKCRKLIQTAGKILCEEGSYLYGIEACNEVLDRHGHNIRPEMRCDCLCLRAALLLKRKWKNDVHMAIRDCAMARKIDSSSFGALYYTSEALLQLDKNKEALEFAQAARSAAPLGSEVTEKMADLERRIAAAEAEKKESNGSTRPGPPIARILSLTEFLRRLEARSRMEAMTERADPEYDGDLDDVDFEISVPGDEGHDLESNILLGSLNVIVHRRSNSRDTDSPSGSCGSPQSQCDSTTYEPEAVVDMKQRFVGHCNLGTDIKQASFLGQKGEYVASGSDDGRCFIWEKKTGRLVKMLLGDEAVVNCVQCHPLDCVVATSGIDSTIKIWTPTSPVPSVVAGGSTGPENANVFDVIEANQRKLRNSRDLHLPFELIERL